MTDLKAPPTPETHAGAPARPLVYAVYRDEDAVSLLEVAAWLYAERYRVLAIAAFAAVAAFALTLAMPTVYRAEVLLVPVSESRNQGVQALIGQLGDVAALVGDLPGAATDRTAESIATLRSRSLALDFIREHDLKRHLYAERWDAAQQAWRDAAEAPSDLEAYRLFDENVREVHVQRRSGLVSLAIEWQNPALAAAWANRLVAEVNTRQRAAAIRETRQSIEYLERQLEQISSVEVRQAVYRLIESQTKTIALAHAREEYAFKVIDPAVVPERPSGPKRRLIALAGLCLGLMIAVAIVLARRAWAGAPNNEPGAS